MYARKYGDDIGQQSFRRGEYTIPANYRGNAFTADEIPDISCTKAEQPPDEAAKNDCDIICEEKNETTAAQQPMCCEDAVYQKEPCKQNCPCSKGNEQCSDANKGEPHRGIFRDLLGRFDRGFELDDLLLIGLIILILNSDKDECESSRDEIIILLAFLLLSGF